VTSAILHRTTKRKGKPSGCHQMIVFSTTNLTKVLVTEMVKKQCKATMKDDSTKGSHDEDNTLGNFASCLLYGMTTERQNLCGRFLEVEKLLTC
jgi:hypothetical protein